MKKLASLICATSLIFAAAGPAAFAGGDHGKGEIQGCLGAGKGEGWYVLTKKKKDGTKEIAVMGNDSFAAHIGHEVKVTGAWKEGEGDKKYFNATGLEHIAASCPE